MSLYGWIRSAFRAVVPARARRWLWQRDNRLVRWLSQRKQRLAAGATYNEIYDTEYFQTIGGGMDQSAAVIARTVADRFRPSRVVDIGCGSGGLLAAFAELKIPAVGFDHAEAALAACRARGLDARPIDLLAATELGERADVAVSTEVAEHLPPEAADRFVALLCQAAPVVVLTAAHPGQGGTEHLNEQPNEYWVQKFAALGHQYLADLTADWRAGWKAAGVHVWYFGNVMVFAADAALPR